MSTRLVLRLLAATLAIGVAPQIQAQPGRTDLYGDPLPDGAVGRLGTVRLRHLGSASSVAFSRDGRTLVSSGHDETVRLWDVASGRELRPLHGHGAAAVNAIAVSPDGKHFVSAGDDRAVCIWETDTGRQVRRLGGLAMHVSNVAFSADGKLLAAAGAVTPVYVWDAATARELRQLQGPLSAVRSLAFAPSGSTLATGSVGGTVRLWDASSGAELREFRAHKGAIESLAWTPDGKTLISASNDVDGLVRQWDPASGKEIGQLQGPLSPQMRIALSPDGKLLAVASDEVLLWSTAARKEVRRLKLARTPSRALAFSPDGKRLASANANGTLSLWDVESGKEDSPFRAHTSPITKLAFAPGSKTVVAGGDGPLVLWDVASQKHLRHFGGEDAVIAVAFSPDGRTLLAAGSDKSLRQWDPVSGTLRQRGRGWSSGAVAIAPDGKTLAARAADGTLALWSVAGEKLGTLDDKTFPAAALAFTPDGKIIAAAREKELPALGEVPVAQATLRLWRTATKNPLPQFADYHDQAWALAFSPDSRRLAVGELGATCIWEMASGERVRELLGSEGLVDTVAFAPGGRLLAAASTDGTVRLWDTATNKDLGQLKGHEEKVQAVAFSPDGRLLATGSADNTVLLWDLSRWQAARRPEERLGPTERAALWSLLAGKDAAAAHRAVWRLADSPEEGVPFVAAKLKEVSQGQAQATARLPELIRNLDNDRFAVREQTMAELAKLPVTLVAPALQQVLEGRPTLEQRRRIEKLLSKMAGPLLVQETLRLRRAVEVLELAGTGVARTALAFVAREASGAPLAEDAAETLERLKRRDGSPK